MGTPPAIYRRTSLVTDKPDAPKPSAAFLMIAAEANSTTAAVSLLRELANAFGNGTLEHAARQLLPLVERVEEILQCRPQVLAVAAIASVGQRGQELHVPDQVSQTELHPNATLPHVAPVGRKVITSQDAVSLVVNIPA